jgi:hypothetical protein
MFGLNDVSRDDVVSGKEAAGTIELSGRLR